MQIYIYISYPKKGRWLPVVRTAMMKSPGPSSRRPA